MGYVLFFAAWVGHSALWLVGLNVLYSQPLNRTFLRIARLVVAILVFGFPFVLWAVVGLDLLAVNVNGPPPGLWAVQVYLGLCFYISFWAIPVMTLFRLLRPTPRQLRGRKRRIVDVAA